MLALSTTTPLKAGVSMVKVQVAQEPPPAAVLEITPGTVNEYIAEELSIEPPTEPMAKVLDEDSVNAPDKL